MSTIYLKVKGLAGSEVLQVSKEAIELANKVGVAVEFDFNGVVCVARPNESAESLAKNWEQEVSSKKKYKFASSEEVNTVEKERIEVEFARGFSVDENLQWVSHFYSNKKITDNELLAIKSTVYNLLNGVSTLFDNQQELLEAYWKMKEKYEPNPEPSSKKEEVEDKPFVWTDELVKEFIEHKGKYMSVPDVVGIAIEEFKKSKTKTNE